MPFEIIWSDSAARQLRKLDRQIARRIYDKVGELAHEPFRSVRRLAGEPYYRLRVGDYRALLRIREQELQILVLRVGHRESVY
jgi:mRNA interferase RelE/StbE